MCVCVTAFVYVRICVCVYVPVARVCLSRLSACRFLFRRVCVHLCLGVHVCVYPPFVYVFVACVCHSRVFRLSSQLSVLRLYMCVWVCMSVCIRRVCLSVVRLCLPIRFCVVCVCMSVCTLNRARVSASRVYSSSRVAIERVCVSGVSLLCVFAHVYVSVSVSCVCTCLRACRG